MLCLFAMAIVSLSKARIFAVLLAAGQSHRFGTTKQLASFGDENLVHRAARLARAACGERSLIVVGHRASEVSQAADRECEFMLVNDHYSQGIGASIALAAKAMNDAADALIFLLADQPLITKDHLNNLIAAWSGADNHIVASEFGMRKGPPILMPSGAYSYLRKLSGDQGGKQLMENDEFVVSTVAFEAAGIDIDTPDDLERLLQAAE